MEGEYYPGSIYDVNECMRMQEREIYLIGELDIYKANKRSRGLLTYILEEPSPFSILMYYINSYTNLNTVKNQSKYYRGIWLP